MSRTPSAPTRLGLPALLALVAGPLVVGVALRLWNLQRQALLDDEMHGLRLALAQPISVILSKFRVPDCSLPLTALTRLALDHGVVLSELLLRAPSILLGCLLIPLGGLFLARRDSPLAGAVFAGLAASSPLLVIYSRNARPYAVATTLGFLGLVLFDSAWRHRSPARMAAAAVTGVVGVWSLPTMLAIVGAPWAIGFVVAARERWRGEKWRRELTVGLAILFLGLALVLAPRQASIRSVVSGRAATVRISIGPAIREGARLVAGARSPVLAAALLLAAVSGLALALRRRELWAAWLAGSVAAHLLGLAVLRDYSLSYALGVGRSLSLALPMLLAGSALLCARVARVARERVGLAAALGLATALVPLGFGPLPERLLVLPELLSAGERMQFTFDSSQQILPLPEIYGREPLASARTVADGVQIPEGLFLRPLGGEALSHRRRVLPGILRQELPPDRVRLRAVAPLGIQELLASDADALVLRLRPGSQAVALARQRGIPLRKFELARATALDAAAERTRQRFVTGFGPPDATDDERWVWDLRRLRRSVR